MVLEIEFGFLASDFCSVVKVDTLLVPYASVRWKMASLKVDG